MKFARHLDKIGSIGAIIAAAMAPCCFPLLGVVGAALGLGAMERFAPQLQYAVQALVALAWVGAFISYRQHRVVWTFILASLGMAICFTHYYIHYSEHMVYTAFALLLVSGVWSTIIRMNKQSIEPILKSTITCPHCGHQETERMPADACQYFWDCPKCEAKLKPNKGDCCVFCSFGSIPCPPIQLDRGCCLEEPKADESNGNKPV